jgi:hypothetical protein
MERVGDRWGKMERYCSTGQSPQRAVAATEDEEEEESPYDAGNFLTNRQCIRFAKELTSKYLWLVR